MLANIGEPQKSVECLPVNISGGVFFSPVVELA